MSNRRLNAQITIGGTVARSLTKGLTDTRGQLAEVGGAIRNAESQQRRLSREMEAMGRQGMNIDPLRRRYAQLSEEIDRLRRRQAALNRLAAADVGGKFRTMTTEVGRLARRTAMLGTAAAGGIFAIASSTSSLGDNIAKTADKLGIGTTALQELRYAAEQSGVGAGVLDTAMQRMVRRVSEAARGTGAAKDAIDELGLSAEALASMTPDEQMRHIADAMADVTNQGDRVRLAMKLFDTEGVVMVNMLRQGAQGLDELGEAAHRVGYVLSEQATRDAEKFQDNLADVKLSLGGLKNIIGAELMPVVSDMMGQFTGWLAENRDQVREWSELFASRLRDLVPAIGELARGVASVVHTVGRAVNRTAELVGGFDNLAMIVGGLFASKAIVAVGAFVVALGKAGAAVVALAGTLPAVATGLGVVAGGVKAIGLALMANPIGLVIGAIAGGAYLIIRNWDKIGPFFSAMWEGVQRLAIATWQGLKRIVSWSPIAAVAGAWGGLKDWFGGLWDGITAAAQKALDWITGRLEWVGNAFGRVKGWFSWGDDADEEDVRRHLGGSNASSLGLTSRSEQRAASSGRAVQSATPAPQERPSFAAAGEKVREVVNNITNNLTLHVTRREGEGDDSYARRITDLVIEELNARQQGALYDG